VDDRLFRGDRGLVEAIAAEAKEVAGDRNHSFATKYCSLHRPAVNPHNPAARPARASAMSASARCCFTRRVAISPLTRSTSAASFVEDGTCRAAAENADSAPSRSATPSRSSPPRIVSTADRHAAATDERTAYCCSSATSIVHARAPEGHDAQHVGAPLGEQRQFTQHRQHRDFLAQHADMSSSPSAVARATGLRPA
jgi:hypothetical protein